MPHIPPPVPSTMVIIHRPLVPLWPTYPLYLHSLWNSCCLLSWHLCDSLISIWALNLQQDAPCTLPARSFIINICGCCGLTGRSQSLILSLQYVTAQVNNGTWGGYLAWHLPLCWLLDISQIPSSIHVLCLCRHRSVHPQPFWCSLRQYSVTGTQI